MRHPFELTSAELEDLELDFEELLTNEEAANVSGGRDWFPWFSLREKLSELRQRFTEPKFTTQAIPETGNNGLSVDEV